MHTQNIIQPTRRWLETLVVGMDLCPFAAAELVDERVRFAVTWVDSEERLLAALQAELERLDEDASVETTLLIHPGVLGEFGEYNQFLNRADNLLESNGWVGCYQVASFHPDYRFAGTAPDAAQNYTNRSPYPMLHLLREASVERAIAGYGDTARIPARNIALLEDLGRERMESLLQGCIDANEC